MASSYLSLWINLIRAMALIGVVANYPAQSQITPDSTLGNENSQVITDLEINGIRNDRIDGGAIRGSNLFHSFQEFNINEGRGAYFSNPDGITNILTRVTGTNPSHILGTLGVLGNANLFFINPNGIVFGPNSRLDLRGSFFASTASGIVFDELEFRAVNPEAPPLLAINIPIGLRFRDRPSAIVDRSSVTQPSPLLPFLEPIFNQIGLAVDSGQTLALIGGDIQLNNGSLTASSGQVLLGSVASGDLVNFVPTPFGLTLNYDNIQSFGNIQIANRSSINTSGAGGGRVEIRGNNVNISGNSAIFALTQGDANGRGVNIRANSLQILEGAQISTFTFARGAGGAIAIDATDSVELSGVGTASFQQFINQLIATGTIQFLEPVVLVTAAGGAGKAGDLTIETGRLLLRNGAGVGSVALGTGDGGNIMLRANDIEIVGSGINSGTLAGSTGNGGNIAIDTGRLSVRDGSVLTTLTLGQGSSGNITIKATESVEALKAPDGVFSPTLINTTALRGNGKAGDITIDTGRLTVGDGAVVDSSSGGFLGSSLLSTEAGRGGNVTVRASESVEVFEISGNITDRGVVASGISATTTTSSNGGEVRISTPYLLVRDGGVVSTSSFIGQGNAGNIIIDAQQIEVRGSTNNGQIVSQIQAFAGRIFSTPTPSDRGNAGSLTLNVNRLIVRDRATVNALSFTGGQAGSITVVGDTIALDNRGRIQANTTSSGGGGNINLQATDIQLRRGSRITTNAGTSNGGQININSDILLAFPQENSDITANAATGSGGRVNINTNNIFGATEITREQIRDRLGLTDAEFAALQATPTTLLNTSDIAAISQVAGPSLQGTVTFSTSGINPAQGLVQLPQNVVDPATLMAANPCTRGATSEFVITGRGGLPVTPMEALGDLGVGVNWSDLPAGEAGGRGQEAGGRGNFHPSSFTPATGWMISDRGEVTLTAYNASNTVSGRIPLSSNLCGAN